MLRGKSILSQLLQITLEILKKFIEASKKLKDVAGKMTEGQDPEQIKQKKIREELEKKRKLLIQAFRFFYENSAHIDVVRNEKLEIIYFILLPFTKALPKENKTEFHEEVDRSNTKSKVSDLVEKSDELIEICKHEQWLKKSKNPFLKFFYNYIPTFKEISFIMTLLINMTIMLSYSDQYGDRLVDVHLYRMPDYTVKRTMQFFMVAGVIISFSSVFFVTFLLLKELPLIYKKVFKEEEAKQEDE